MSVSHRLTSTVALKVLQENYISKIRDIESEQDREECAKLCAKVALDLCKVGDIEKPDKARREWRRYLKEKTP